MNSLQVQPVPGEPACFMVEGHLLQCSNPQCGRLSRRVPPWFAWFSSAQKALLRKLGVWTRVEKELGRTVDGWDSAASGQCPKCGAALERRFHRVDLLELDLNGWCSCEFFSARLHADADKATKADRVSGLFRCSHIEAARSFALDVSLAAHAERTRKK